MTARDHNKLLSVLFMVVGGIATVVGLFIGIVYGIVGLAIGVGSGEPEGALVGGVMVIFAIVIGFFIVLFGGLHAMTGWKLYKEKPGARTWATISSILVLLNFPFGTALGIYGLWFAQGDMGKQLYMPGYVPSMPPPPAQQPPHNWQQ